MANEEENKKTESGEPNPPATTPPKKKETVEVDRSILDQILEKQKVQDELIAKQTLEIERLNATGDLKRLAKWDSDHKGELIRTAQVATMIYEGEERVVIGWRSLTNTVRMENGILKEDQTGEYWLESYEGDPEDEDGNKIPIKIEKEQRLWYHEIGRKKADIVKESSTPSGSVTKVLRFQDGKEIEFDVTFINP